MLLDPSSLLHLQRTHSHERWMTSIHCLPSPERQPYRHIAAKCRSSCQLNCTLYTHTAGSCHKKVTEILLCVWRERRREGNVCPSCQLYLKNTHTHSWILSQIMVMKLLFCVWQEKKERKNGVTWQRIHISFLVRLPLITHHRTPSTILSSSPSLSHEAHTIVTHTRIPISFFGRMPRLDRGKGSTALSVPRTGASLDI